jgi:hypothetical protein
MDVRDLRVYVYNNDEFRDDYGELPDGRRVVFESYPLAVVEGFVEGDYKDKVVVKLEILDAKGNLLHASTKETKIEPYGEIYAGFRLEKKIRKATQAAVTVSLEKTKIERLVSLPKQHRLYGRVTDFEGKPVQAYVMINSTKFRGCGSAKTDAKGYFELMLPERRYQQIFVCDKNYGRSTLEFYGWNLYLDRDIELNARVDKIEIYRIAVGVTPERTVIIDFVPMDVFHTVKGIHKDLKQKAEVDYSSSKYYPPIKLGEVEVYIDNKRAEVWTLHKRQHSLADSGLKNKTRPAYTLEAKIPTQIRPGRHTLKLVIHKRIRLRQETIEEWGESTYFELDVWT